MFISKVGIFIKYILYITFLLLFFAVVLWLFRCCNDGPNILNAVQLTVYLAAASRFGHLRSGCRVSRTTLSARFVQKRTLGTSLSIIFLLDHDH